MKERIIRKLTPDDLPQFMEIYLNAYPAGKDLSEDCYEKYYKRNLQSMLEYEHVNFYGLFEDEVLIAQMKLIDFDMNLYGEMRKATGLMALAVHPLHKKKGAARDMVKFFEKYTVETGGAASLLLPFRMDFYRKLGYGCGTKMDEYHIPTEYLPKADDISHLTYMGCGQVDQVIECYSSFVRKNHGALYKFEEEIRDMEGDDEVRRLGYFEGETLKGYAAFTFLNTSDCNYTLNLMDVKELVYEDAEVLKELLAGLRMQADLAQSVIIRTGEPDFYHLLASAQDVSGNYIDFGFLQTNVSAIGTMYKIPDVKAFIEASAHRMFPETDLTAVFEVNDELAGSIKTFALSFNGGKWSYHDSQDIPGSADVKVSCNLAELSSLLMGSAEFGGLIRTGAVKVDNPDYVRILDMMLHAEQKPFTNTDY